MSVALPERERLALSAGGRSAVAAIAGPRHICLGEADSRSIWNAPPGLV